MKQVAISAMRVFAAAVLFLSAHLAQAAIRLPHVFGNNMVLQQGRHVPVWGKASPGEIVTVSFAGQSVRATAGADGRWRPSTRTAHAASVDTATSSRSSD